MSNFSYFMGSMENIMSQDPVIALLDKMIAELDAELKTSAAHKQTCPHDAAQKDPKKAYAVLLA
jgi:hypothetical protein